MLYTYSKLWKNKIAFSYRDENLVKHDKLISEYKPRFYVETTKDTGILSYLRQPVEERQFDSVYEAKQWLKEMKDTPIRVHGNGNIAQQFVVDVYEGKDITPNTSDVRILYFDIETYSPDGFPYPEEANYEINAITIYDSYISKYYVFALCDYDMSLDETNRGLDIEFTRFQTETELIMQTISKFREINADIITGFNSYGFDIPYIINRFEKVVGVEATSHLSPFGVISKREVTDKSFFVPKKVTEFEILGTTHLDYKKVYEKHAYSTLDSFSLNSIAEYELGEKKLSYEEEGSLHNLYVTNPQKFVEYNIRDVKLMTDIENKRKLFDMIISIAYLAKANFEDTMGTKRLWEARIASTLYNTNMVPLYERQSSDLGKDLVGAYVREPVPGKHGWGMVVDAASLYPSLVRQYNMDLATHIPYYKLPKELQAIADANYTIDDLLEKKADLSALKKYNVCMTANFEFFDNSFRGIIPQEQETLYFGRKTVKAESKKHTDIAYTLKEGSEEWKKEKTLAEQKDTLQHGLKILLNSCYGAITLKYFNYYKFEIGEAITTSGQLSNRWNGNYINRFFKEQVLSKPVKMKKYRVKIGGEIKELWEDELEQLSQLF